MGHAERDNVGLWGGWVGWGGGGGEGVVAVVVRGAEELTQGFDVEL